MAEHQACTIFFCRLVGILEYNFTPYPLTMQVALVPHTDRSSAFYLAMIRAAEAVSGLMRSAERPEMALLVSGGALAKGAP